MNILTALKHHEAGRLKEAIDAYRLILKTTPNNTDALHLMAHAMLQTGDTEQALRFATRAVTLAPNNPHYQLTLGTVYSQTGQHDKVLECYRRVLTLQPNSASAHFGIANTLMSLNRLPEAEQGFLAALNAQSAFPEASYNLGNLYKELGKLEAAVEHFRQAVTHRPDFADAHHNLASTLNTLGREDEAIASYHAALPGRFPETYNNLANIYLKRDMIDEALRHYEQAVSIKPDYAEAWNNLGKALLGAKKFDDAALCCERAIALAPKMADAHFNLGVVRGNQNRFTDAIDSFSRALAFWPGHADTLYNIAFIHNRMGRREEAERLYRQVLELHPDHIGSHINLSEILMAKDRKEEAQKHIAFAYLKQNLFERHSLVANKSILLLFDAGKGNINLSHLFNEAANNLYDWMIEFATDAQMASLPHYDLVFNAMGDPDLTGGDVASPIARFLRMNSKPLLNPPDKVARTARHVLPNLISDIDGLVIPQLWRCADGNDWHESTVAALPLLARPVHTQGGIGMVKLETSEALAEFRATQPEPMYVSRFIDYRSPDGYCRKYRIIFIDREPYPYHLAISSNWLVHYYTADMPDHAWKLEEEKRFLDDPEAVLGPRGMAAIRAVGQRLDLDYAGIDFSLTADGRVLVFESNPTMLVHPEDENGPTRHKNPYIKRILDAFEAKLQRTVDAASIGG